MKFKSVSKLFTPIYHTVYYKLLKLSSYETVLQIAVLQTKTSAHRVTPVRVKAHMNPCFTLASGCLVVTESKVLKTSGSLNSSTAHDHKPAQYRSHTQRLLH
jgi:hypothetical protein